ncbi:MAG TPA: hypothetical protein VFC67_04680 [Prolixibacteraceae bacterium]|nr:hypothetical protein [Prolixibacteraceae bacterium]
MKKIATLFLAFLICLTVKSQSNYLKGFEAGYKAGIFSFTIIKDCTNR